MKMEERYFDGSDRYYIAAKDHGDKIQISTWFDYGYLSKEKARQLGEWLIKHSSNDKLKKIASIKYKCCGHQMVGVFNNNNTHPNPEHQNKWFIYFRNADDERLKKLMDDLFSEPDDCLDNALVKLKEMGYL